MRRASGFDGTSVVQTHMTNSRLTDPEVLEFRFPVRLDSYEIRRARAGPGGGGVVTAACAACASWRPMTASILSNGRRSTAPFGMAGGQPGQVGINRVVRATAGGGTRHIGQAEMRAG
jgi:5-oxoprolinase (ATP-hydrolysing)